MLRPLFLLAISLPMLASAQSGDRTLKTVEQAIEISASSVRLPERAPSTLFAAPCPTCAAKSLQVGPKTRFFIGREVVTQQQFNRAVGRASEAALIIFYSPATNDITRLVASGAKPVAN